MNLHGLGKEIPSPNRDFRFSMWIAGVSQPRWWHISQACWTGELDFLSFQPSNWNVGIRAQMQLVWSFIPFWKMLVALYWNDVLRIASSTLTNGMSSWRLGSLFSSFPFDDHGWTSFVLGGCYAERPWKPHRRSVACWGALASSKGAQRSKSFSSKWCFWGQHLSGAWLQRPPLKLDVDDFVDTLHQCVNEPNR